MQTLKEQHQLDPTPTTETPRYWTSMHAQVTLDPPFQLIPSLIRLRMLTAILRYNSQGSNHYHLRFTSQHSQHPLPNRVDSDQADYGGDLDLAIFQAIRNQIQGRRIARQNLIKNHLHLSLTFSKMDYQEAAALVTRVAPDLSSFLHAYYPQFHRETNSSHQADDKHTEDLPSILEEISSTPHNSNQSPTTS